MSVAVKFPGIARDGYRDDLVENLSDHGWWFSRGEHTVKGFGLDLGPAWEAFADEWNHLLRDEHMRDGGTYRYRRYSAFEYDDLRRSLRQLPHQPYEQSAAVNRLNGGFKRHFEPLRDSFVGNRNFSRIVTTFGEIFSRAAGHARWNVKLHPYRIVARDGARGEPAPEGLHKDGVDFIVSYMIRRVNVVGGISTITDDDRSLIGDVELGHPHDFVVGNDRVTYHGVSSVHVEDPRKAFAFRDVLVIAFERIGA
ncbi:conserved hypothetical protein [Methylobacterium sp. 4-46]|uniref:2OG-Fe dioxygenase family protein n=1 Tax=unclassified Methylobacterium TaxID=2615210 RepID=UPI000165CD6D|nr:MULTISPECIES: 2OG-Fe dioxygenase family protein [Methylobacterium]ACA20401.1 conserved hypothetical protein [Methylobacterium sp. 4-46]WFT79570.1 2OG-Fe dioxygenase family protein [Methylobacterium nodulans]